MLWPPMKPQLFQKIILKVTSDYQVVNLEDLLQNPDQYRCCKKRLATILFDDGYKDNIEYAAPILKKYNCPASFYVVTDSISRNVPTWTYILDYAVQHTKKEKLQLPEESVPSRFKELQLQGEGVKGLKPWLKTLSNSDRKVIVEVLLDQIEDVTIPRSLMMNWDEVRELHNSGFTIGSHTHTHPMLASLESENEITQELETSFNILSEKLGAPPLTISYPIGSFDGRVKEISRQVGYQYGLAVKQRFFNQDMDDQLEIPRVELYQEPWWKVSARMHGIYNQVKRLWN